MPSINLFSHQEKVLPLLSSGSILYGGVGAGKSRTSIAYFFRHVCHGDFAVNGVGETKQMRTPTDLVIITTAKKRDIKEWDKELAAFSISVNNREDSFGHILVRVDSWNNIAKYAGESDTFFIFDEQRLVGKGAWVKAFLKIAKGKGNKWIVLTATPGDTWSDYIPVFIANGFYKNRTEFGRRHIVYDRFSRYPKIVRYLEEERLQYFRNQVLVEMNYKHDVKKVKEWVDCSYDGVYYESGLKDRWDMYKREPLRDASAVCYYLRRVTGSDRSRFLALLEVLEEHPRAIIFYNFDYELEILKELAWYGYHVGQWNGHVHDDLSDFSDEPAWVYLVQYNAGSEGWNCTSTDTVIFYSLSYSYKTMAQSEGRIDRVNSPFDTLWYCLMWSKSSIEVSIRRALERKADFNGVTFVSKNDAALSKTTPTR